MSKPSVRSPKFSPLLWLVPLPFVLAMCLPIEPPTLRSAPSTEHQRIVSTSTRDATAEEIGGTPSNATRDR